MAAILDLSGEQCPVTTVRALNYLQSLPSGSIAQIILDRGIPEANVPKSLAAAGYIVFSMQPWGPGSVIINIQKP